MSNEPFVNPSAVSRLLELSRGENGLRPRALRVGIALSLFMGQEGNCWPSRSKLSSRTGLDGRAVTRALRDLEKCGFMSIVHRPGRSSTYTLTPGRNDPRLKQPSVEKTLGQTDLYTLGQIDPPERTIELTKEKITKRTRKKADSKKSGASTKKHNGGSVWVWWVDANRAAGRRDPVRSAPDLRAAKNISGMINNGELTEEKLKGAMEAYLAMTEPFIVKEGHALRFLAGKLPALFAADAAAVGQDAEYAAVIQEATDSGYIDELESSAREGGSL